MQWVPAGAKAARGSSPTAGQPETPRGNSAPLSGPPTDTARTERTRAPGQGAGAHGGGRHAKRGAAWPQISPDGTQVLWIAEMRDRMPIIVTDVASGESRELTPDKRAAAESPRWSPDGRQIVFASMFGSAAQGRNDIFVMDADGSNVRNLSRNGGENFDPKWAADGRSVVFASLRSGTSLLYEVSLFDGTTQPVSVHASHDMDHFVRPVASR